MLLHPGAAKIRVEQQPVQRALQLGVGLDGHRVAPRGERHLFREKIRFPRDHGQSHDQGLQNGERPQRHQDVGRSGGARRALLPGRATRAPEITWRTNGRYDLRGRFGCGRRTRRTSLRDETYRLRSSKSLSSSRTACSVYRMIFSEPREAPARSASGRGAGERGRRREHGHGRSRTRQAIEARIAGDENILRG